MPCMPAQLCSAPCLHSAKHGSRGLEIHVDDTVLRHATMERRARSCRSCAQVLHAAARGLRSGGSCTAVGSELLLAANSF